MKTSDVAKKVNSENERKIPEKTPSTYQRNAERVNVRKPKGRD